MTVPNCKSLQSSVSVNNSEATATSTALRNSLSALWELPPAVKLNRVQKPIPHETKLERLKSRMRLRDFIEISFEMYPRGFKKQLHTKIKMKEKVARGMLFAAASSYSPRKFLSLRINGKSSFSVARSSS